MIQLHITLDIGNDAFADNPVPEAQRVIGEALAKSFNLEDLDGTKIYDSNGNAVGCITVSKAGSASSFETWAKSWELSEDAEGFGLAQIAWNEAVKQSKGVHNGQ